MTPSGRATTARSDGDGWVLDGTKTNVPAALVADTVLVPATTPEGASGVFVVAADAPGLSCERQATTTGTPEAQLVLAGVRLGGDAALGPVDAGRDRPALDRRARHRRRLCGDGGARRRGGADDRRVHVVPRAVRTPDRHLPGRGPAGRRRLRRRPRHPAHDAPGRLATHGGVPGGSRGGDRQVLGRPPAASGSSTPPSTSTAASAWTATTRSTATSCWPSSSS